MPCRLNTKIILVHRILNRSKEKNALLAKQLQMFDSEKRDNTIKRCYHGAKKTGDNLEFNTQPIYHLTVRP